MAFISFISFPARARGPMSGHVAHLRYILRNTSPPLPCIYLSPKSLPRASRRFNIPFPPSIRFCAAPAFPSSPFPPFSRSSSPVRCTPAPTLLALPPQWERMYLSTLGEGTGDFGVSLIPSEKSDPASPSAQVCRTFVSPLIRGSSVAIVHLSTDTVYTALCSATCWPRGLRGDRFTSSYRLTIRGVSNGTHPIGSSCRPSQGFTVTLRRGPAALDCMRQNDSMPCASESDLRPKTAPSSYRRILAKKVVGRVKPHTSSSSST